MTSSSSSRVQHDDSRVPVPTHRSAPTPVPILRLYRFSGDEISLPSEVIEELCYVADGDDGRTTHFLKIYQNCSKGLRAALSHHLATEMEATASAQEFIEEQISFLESQAFHNSLQPACPVKDWGIDKTDFTAVWRIGLVDFETGEEITGTDLPFTPGEELSLHVLVREVKTYRIVRASEPLPDFACHDIDAAAFILEVSASCERGRLDSIRGALTKGYFGRFSSYIAGLCFDATPVANNINMFECLPQTWPECGHAHPLQLLSIKSRDPDPPSDDHADMDDDDVFHTGGAFYRALRTQDMSWAQSLRFFSANSMFLGRHRTSEFPLQNCSVLDLAWVRGGMGEGYGLPPSENEDSDDDVGEVLDGENGGVGGMVGGQSNEDAEGVDIEDDSGEDGEDCPEEEDEEQEDEDDSEEGDEDEDDPEDEEEEEPSEDDSVEEEDENEDDSEEDGEEPSEDDSEEEDEEHSGEHGKDVSAENGEVGSESSGEIDFTNTDGHSLECEEGRGFEFHLHRIAESFEFLSDSMREGVAPNLRKMCFRSRYGISSLLDVLLVWLSEGMCPAFREVRSVHIVFDDDQHPNLARKCILENPGKRSRLPSRRHHVMCAHSID